MVLKGYNVDDDQKRSIDNEGSDEKEKQKAKMFSAFNAKKLRLQGVG